MLAARGVARCAAYSAAQAALLQLTRSLAVERGRRGITINAVGSGWQQDSPFLPAADDEQQRLRRHVPDHCLRRPDDLAALTVYLASDGGEISPGRLCIVKGA
ncbi:MAG TPA: SDR family oxidoreductase [Candidatus Tectomicrobia bacterium]